ncbi:hypothetical protein JTE90_019482 [Oedothorax gibbosus]|uniref:Uncharacterized protein n=1 Tax=Oedothorax gibbosus TaxID=931172 RepID=A0AAV6UKN2_9ARAC|nr:hypothetical protein JTE90_019482 [Oedothorax gibbosus]
MAKLQNLARCLLAAYCISILNVYASDRDTSKRPFYIIGHMVNSIRQVKHYLDRGSNALESDIQFFNNGSVSYIYHGFPCDCWRTCSYHVPMSDYLKHVRDITDPDIEDSYHEKMLLQMLDLKLSTSGNKTESGRDVARHVLDFLWSKDGKRKTEVRVLIYLDDVTSDQEFVSGFLAEFQDRGQERRLADVGFDGGSGNLFDNRRTLLDIGIKNVWQGDGRTNCVSAFYPDGRLRRAIALRDARRGKGKVYHWTIDLKLRMRLSLNLGVDAILTNDPDDLLEVVRESYYAGDYRLATVDDDPFEKYVKE